MGPPEPLALLFTFLVLEEAGAGKGCDLHAVSGGGSGAWGRSTGETIPRVRCCIGRDESFGVPNSSLG